MRRSGSGDWAGLFNCNYWIDRTAGVAGVLWGAKFGTIRLVYPLIEDGRVTADAVARAGQLALESMLRRRPRTGPGPRLHAAGRYQWHPRQPRHPGTVGQPAP